MFEKIKNAQWHFQLILLVSIAAVLYLSVWYFVTSVTREEVAKLNEEVAALQAKNEAARVATQRINEFRALFASKTQEYEELKVLLPEQREITNVLQGLQDTARNSRMVVMRFSPKEDVQKESVMSKPVEIEGTSNFVNVRAFFDQMAKLPRIVSITDFKLTQLNEQSSEKTLSTQFTLSAYYADPNALNKPAAPAPGTPGAPAQPAPAAQPPAAK